MPSDQWTPSLLPVLLCLWMFVILASGLLCRQMFRTRCSLQHPPNVLLSSHSSFQISLLHIQFKQDNNKSTFYKINAPLIENYNASILLIWKLRYFSIFLRCQLLSMNEKSTVTLEFNFDTLFCYIFMCWELLHKGNFTEFPIQGTITIISIQY